jgi:DNA repair exonuclease SbcCD ATPase subunit/DNA repair exonuclease SbcCD nuclease subunit
MLRYIFHISDIHIRNGDRDMSRFDEYMQVFDNLFTSLKQSIKKLSLHHNQYIIIISGDVFHNKSVIGNYGLRLYKELITNLTKIGRTIIFHGNHDKNQNDTEQPSLVSCTVDMDNLMILHDSQSFTINNVGFSYVNIDDTLDPQRTCGRIEELPPFPSIQDQVDYKVALFHGTFAHVKLYNGREVLDTTSGHRPYPLEWMKDFDFAILGDIHLRQCHKYKDTLWGYSGSLLQQDIGEDIINHGYIIWDLHDKTVQDVNVYNHYGIIKVKEHNDILLTFHQNQWTSLEELIKKNKELFPKQLDVRLYSDVDTRKLARLMSNYRIHHNITNRIKDKELSTNMHDNNDAIDVSVDTNTILEYFHRELTESQYNVFANIAQNHENLLLHIADYPKELHDDCHKRNKDILAGIQSCLKSKDTQTNRKQFYIKYLEWENLYCYEGKNWIDFQDTANSTFLISGNNGTGKSAIYDILVLAIWGDITFEKQNTLSRGIVHSKCDKGYTIIDIELDRVVYRIYKTFNTVSNKNLIHKKHNTLYKYLSNNTITQLYVDNACTQEIIRLFGTLTEFLTSSMITQNLDANILDMDYSKCIALIDKVSNIEYINNFYLLFKTSINKYKDFKKIVESKKQVYENYTKNISNVAYDDINVDSAKTELNELERQKRILVDENNSLTVPLDESILSVDYNSAIADLGTIQIKDDEQKESMKETCNQIKKILRHIPADKQEQLKQSFTKELKSKYLEYKGAGCVNEFRKPCEYSFIESEENILTKYNDPPQLDAKYSQYTEDQLYELIIKIPDLEAQLKEMQVIKPVTVEKPTWVNEYHKHDISLDTLIEYCQNHPKRVVKSKNKGNIQQLTYTDYILLSKQNDDRGNDIKDKKTRIEELDRSINELYQELSLYANTSEPTSEKPYEPFVVFSTDDMDRLCIDLDKYQNILEIYYVESDKISAYEKELQNLQKEYTLLNTQEEFKYNPRCKYCCQRPWVHRIHELSRTIKDLEKRIEEAYNKLYDDAEYDYLEVYDKCEQIQKQLEHNHIVKEWMVYMDYNNKCDLLNGFLKIKKELLESIKDLEMTIETIQDKLDLFHTDLWNIYEKYICVVAYEEYDKWLQSYNAVHDEFTSLKQIKKYLFYQRDILPRKKNLEDLKKKYDQWSEYKSLEKIVFAHDLDLHESSLATYEKYKEYVYKKGIQPLVRRKVEIQGLIQDIDTKIKDLNNQLSSHTTYESIYRANEENHALLTKSLETVDNMIEVMGIIIDKFKDYKKYLYDSHILKTIVGNANNIIRELCHMETKSFELDYILSEIKDSIHIHWLIKNDMNINVSEKQIISVSQASGFQRFAISTALRMTLFNNKSCSQLFIDEGFTACDKLNLSIVPSFLARLLNIYNSIIIVSHIDIIQESIENRVAIQYNSFTKSSRMQYGTCQTPETQRKQKNTISVM